MRTLAIALGATVLLAVTAPLSGQAWDVPLFLPPSPGEDIGVYGSLPEIGDWTLVGIWRQEGNLNLGVRLGVWNGAGDGQDDIDILLGGEAYGSLMRATASPLRADWVLGLGGTLGDDFTWLRIPAGVSIGTRLGAGGLNLVPYVLPRVALDVFADDLTNQTETVFKILGDVGVDVDLGEDLKLRVAATIGDREALSGDPFGSELAAVFGAGLALKFGRRVEVR